MLFWHWAGSTSPRWGYLLAGVLSSSIFLVTFLGFQELALVGKLTFEELIESYGLQFVVVGGVFLFLSITVGISAARELGAGVGTPVTVSPA